MLKGCVPREGSAFRLVCSRSLTSLQKSAGGVGSPESFSVAAEGERRDLAPSGHPATGEWAPALGPRCFPLWDRRGSQGLLADGRCPGSGKPSLSAGRRGKRPWSAGCGLVCRRHASKYPDGDGVPEGQPSSVRAGRECPPRRRDQLARSRPSVVETQSQPAAHSLLCKRAGNGRERECSSLKCGLQKSIGRVFVRSRSRRSQGPRRTA